MLYEYLQEKGATGAENAISTAAIQAAFKLGRRGVVQLAADERKAGRLICTGGGAGGYYIPATDEEIIAQRKRLEKGFISRADAVRVFRRACRAMKEGTAGSDGKEARRP